MLKKYFDLQKKILDESRKALSGRKYDLHSYLIGSDEDHIYVSEKGYNLHIIRKEYWLLDNSKLEMFRNGDGLKKCIQEVPDTEAQLTGVTRTASKKRNLVEIENVEGSKVYVDEKYLKYVPLDYCRIYSSASYKPVFFKDSNDDLVAMVMPVII